MGRAAANRIRQRVGARAGATARDGRRVRIRPSPGACTDRVRRRVQELGRRKHPGSGRGARGGGRRHRSDARRARPACVSRGARLRVARFTRDRRPQAAGDAVPDEPRIVTQLDRYGQRPRSAVPDLRESAAPVAVPPEARAAAQSTWVRRTPDVGGRVGANGCRARFRRRRRGRVHTRRSSAA